MTATATGPTAEASGAARRGSKALPWIAGIVALALVAIVAGRPGSGSSSDPFDPASVAPDGAKGLVLLLESFGADVDTTANLPSSDTDVAFMFSDVIAEEDRPQVERWVEDGGVLVVADPYSTWTALVSTEENLSGFGVQPEEVSPGTCDIESLRGLAHVKTGGYAASYGTPPNARSCFTESDVGDLQGSFVIEQRVGQGRVVSLGSPYTFVNDYLDEADNAPLATELLLTPSPSSEDPDGSVHVALLQYGGSAVDDGRTLSDEMGTGAWVAIVQLILAFLVYAWYRARRVGRPIVEPQPVALAGSELVSAVGQLLQQSDDPDRSARALRADIRRRLGERFGLGPHAPPDVVAMVVSERTGVDRDRLLNIVGTRPVTTDIELVELASAIDDLRKEILHGP